MSNFNHMPICEGKKLRSCVFVIIGYRFTHLFQVTLNNYDCIALAI